MTQWVDEVKDLVPDFAKDIRLNLDAVVKRSSLDPVVAEAVALAATFATGNQSLLKVVSAGVADDTERTASLSAAALMGMNNVWYPYVEMTGDAELKGLPAGLRMNVYSTSGGTTKDRFEAYALAASIVGKCHFCVKSHYDILKGHGWTVKQLQDVGRIAAVMTAVAKLV